MEICTDLVECLGPDTSTCIFMLLSDPADLVRASAVSRSWRRFVIANAFCKNLCLRMCPEASNLAHIVEVRSSTETAEVGSSTAVEWGGLEREHRVYAYFSHCLTSPTEKEDCALEPICASSTDNDPDENIINTLDAREQVDMRPSYWSSKGKSDPEAPETLTYRLSSKLHIINEIQIQPFEAFFQFEYPIYSAKAVRFRMGQEIAEDNYKWTYVSPEFPMKQENVLQSFKLPRPAICIGGILQIELLGRVQIQEMDGLYYICVRYVQVFGRRLSPVLDVHFPEPAARPVLRYFPEGQGESSPDGTKPSGWHSLREGINHFRAVRSWNHPILNIMLGLVDSDSDEGEPVAKDDDSFA